MRGILYVKDLFQQRHELAPEAIGALLRTPQYVPESATILSTLQQMRRQRFAFGIVLDEHGGVEGLLTAKDLLAELVGELQDEYDPGIPTVVGIDERTWLADGRLSLEDLSEAIGLSLPEGPYSTAAGLFMASSGKVPEEGEVVDLDRVRLVVLQMDRNRIDRMRVERRR
jgi:putative hemolysin